MHIRNNMAYIYVNKSADSSNERPVPSVLSTAVGLQVTIYLGAAALVSSFAAIGTIALIL
jgi:hypothetical protein